MVITIAGSDSGGEAGLQADLKTFGALGVYGACALTAVTAQNTLGVRAAFVVPPELLAAQLEAVLQDLRPRAGKTGRLFDAAAMSLVAELWPRAGGAPLVVDPVAVDSHRRPLLDESALAALSRELLPQAAVVTPNLHEGELLTGLPVTTPAERRACLEALHALGPRYVLLKGADAAPSGEAVDWLFDGCEVQALSGPRVAGDFGHGAGDTLSAAIVAHLARGLKTREACLAGWAFTRQALARGVRPGAGRGTPGHVAL